MTTGAGFKGKVGLVVGGASGMGNAVVRLLAQRRGPHARLRYQADPGRACSRRATSATTTRFVTCVDR